MLDFKSFIREKPPEPKIASAEKLYHGTTKDHALQIIRQNELDANNPMSKNYTVVFGKYPGVYLSSDLGLAKHYAGKDGFIFILNGRKLANNHTVLQLNPKIFVCTTSILPLNKYVLGVIHKNETHNLADEPPIWAWF